jgi:uncharacterized protein YyaL (SSP411 family)
MLYDNAQLARVYLHAYQVTGNEFYKRVTIEILDYVAREMTDANGGFYSSQDADSEGCEGKFFVWTPEEIRSALGGSASGLLIVSKTKQESNDAQLFMDAYGVTANGNFEGKNILHRARDNDVLAAMRNLDESEVERKLNDARYADAVETALAPWQPALAQAPTGLAWWLCALDFVLTPPKEIVIVGDDAQALLDVVYGEYRPNQVVAWKPRGCGFRHSAVGKS